MRQHELQKAWETLTKETMYRALYPPLNIKYLIFSCSIEGCHNRRDKGKFCKKHGLEKVSTG